MSANSAPLRREDEPTTYRNTLPVDTALFEYRLERVLGSGGFGVTYLARDTNLDRRVAIKEYLPTSCAVRALDGSVFPVNSDSDKTFRWGLDRFNQEARTLARFGHPNIVRVSRFFELNGTGYMVMDYESGGSLSQWLRDHPEPSEESLKALAAPLLEGLRSVHAAGFLHRDIKPANIFIRADGTPVLLDFGAARQAIGDATQSLTSIVTPGYAPFEQYSSDGRQGPWSDVYSFACVLFRAVVGRNPPDAVARLRIDAATTALQESDGRFGRAFVKAIEWGMTVDEKHRPQSVADWMPALLGVSSAPVPAAVAAKGGVGAGVRPLVALPATVRKRSLSARPMDLLDEENEPSSSWWKWMALIVVPVGIIAGGAKLMRKPASSPTPAPATVQPTSGEAALSTPHRDLPVIAVSSAEPNGSRDLSREEMARTMPRLAGRFDEIDVDRNGRVSAQELANFMNADRPIEPPAGSAPAGGVTTQARSQGAEVSGALPALPEQFRAADVNGDGRVSIDEARSAMPPWVARNFIAIDENRDGHVSMEEMVRYRKARQGMRPQRP